MEGRNVNGSKAGKRKLKIRGRVITVKELFKAKKRFHKSLAELSFEEKMKVLDKMRAIVRGLPR